MPKSEFPKGKPILQGCKIEIPGGKVILQGCKIEIPGGKVILQGCKIEIRGGKLILQDCKIEIPNGKVILQCCKAESQIGECLKGAESEFPLWKLPQMSDSPFPFCGNFRTIRFAKDPLCMSIIHQNALLVANLSVLER